MGIHRPTFKCYCKQLDERDTPEPRKKAPGKAPKLDEKPGELGVLDTLLMELHTLHKLLRIAT